MKKRMLAALCAAGVGQAALATIPANLALGDAQLVPAITTITQAQLTASLTHGAFTGVGSLFVSYTHTATTGLGSLCTGSLISSTVVLTAGHCLTDPSSTDVVTGITYYLPSRGERTAANTYTSTSYEVNPNFDEGNLYKGYDLALFTLDRIATGTVYQLYTGDDELGSVFTRVGTGTTGTKSGTAAGPYDYDQRAGQNLYEYTIDDVFRYQPGSIANSILLSDFDDGTAAHDVFGRAGGNQQTGLRDALNNVIDTDSSPGDSGGPEFIDGKIAGVTSFGLTGAIYQSGGACGHPGDIDPYASSTGSCTNFSVGELAGDTRVSKYLGFINGYLNRGMSGAVPEPSSWALMLTGFGFIGGTLRRQNRITARRSA